jgi:hypothetical protein
MNKIRWYEQFINDFKSNFKIISKFSKRNTTNEEKELYNTIYQAGELIDNLQTKDAEEYYKFRKKAEDLWNMDWRGGFPFDSTIKETQSIINDIKKASSNATLNSNTLDENNNRKFRF